MTEQNPFFIAENSTTDEESKIEKSSSIPATWRPHTKGSNQNSKPKKQSQVPKLKPVRVIGNGAFGKY